ncbi:MAG: mRNA surveillance protein pelota [Candidatus Jordarchaeum sp.]|uniref:mRNA surveillance protein pelota n=1 Tax=Candidatus Jordarchaeum sp. TaxID=2823881 RepID=UPI00404A9CC8
MKVYRGELHRGEMKLTPESLTDLWHLYNIIEKGDIVYARTFRRIRRPDEPLRADKGEKTPVYLGITVEDTSLHKYSNRLRVKGIVTDAPESVSRGSHHTINIEIMTPLKIIKDKWPKYILKRVDEAEKIRTTTKLAILSIEEGEAGITIVDNYSVDIIDNISMNIPGKRFVSQHDEAIKNFFSTVSKLLNQVQVDKNVSKIIIAGPGFTKENFLKYFTTKFPDLKNKLILENASYGGVNGVYEVINRGVIEKILEENKVIEDSRLVEEFFIHLAKDDKKVTYGKDAVNKAVLYGAVDKLLIADEKLKNVDLEEREKIDELLRQVEEMGGRVQVVSTLHRAGERLQALGGIAALLRYPLAE